jgi:hypothetical protein
MTTRRVVAVLVGRHALPEGPLVLKVVKVNYHEMQQLPRDIHHFHLVLVERLPKSLVFRILLYVK